MSIAVTGTGPEFCLEGYRRLVATSMGPSPPPPGEVHLQFTFERADTESLLQFVSKATTPDDRFVVRADLGSYRLRPRCGVKIIAPVGIWNVAAWALLDPCDCQDTLWWTIVLPAGAWTPPPFYHRLRVLSGTVTYAGVAVPVGFDLGLPGGGAQLAVVGAAAVQLGFDV